MFFIKVVDWKSVSIYTGSTAKNERDPNKNNKGKIMEEKKNIDEREKCAVYLGGNWYVMFLDVKMSKIIEVGQKGLLCRHSCKNYKVSSHTE